MYLFENKQHKRDKIKSIVKREAEDVPKKEKKEKRKRKKKQSLAEKYWMSLQGEYATGGGGSKKNRVRIVDESLT